MSFWPRCSGCGAPGHHHGGELQRSGLISYRQGEITIRDHAGLEAIACECYRVDHERFNSAVATSRPKN